MAFATAEDLATLLNQPVDTAQAEQALELATEHTRNLLGHTITETTATLHLYVTDPCEQWLPLPQWPVTAVSAVTIAGVTVTDYTVTPTQLWRRDGWIDGAQDSRGEPILVTVACTFGYATVPNDVKALCLDIAARLYRNPGAVVSESVDDYSVTYADGSREALPRVLIDVLRAKFGRSAVVTGR